MQPTLRAAGEDAALAALALMVALSVVLAGASTARAGAVSIKPVCGAVPVGYSRCLSFVKGDGQPFASTPSGYGPADLQSAYALPSNGGFTKVDRKSTRL